MPHLHAEGASRLLTPQGADSAFGQSRKGLPPKQAPADEGALVSLYFAVYFATLFVSTSALIIRMLIANDDAMCVPDCSHEVTICDTSAWASWHAFAHCCRDGEVSNTTRRVLGMHWLSEPLTIAGGTSGRRVATVVGCAAALAATALIVHRAVLRHRLRHIPAMHGHYPLVGRWQTLRVGAPL